MWSPGTIWLWARPFLRRSKKSQHLERELGPFDRCTRRQPMDASSFHDNRLRVACGGDVRPPPYAPPAVDESHPVFFLLITLTVKGCAPFLPGFGRAGPRIQGHQLMHKGEPIPSPRGCATSLLDTVETVEQARLSASGMPMPVIRDDPPHCRQRNRRTTRLLPSKVCLTRSTKGSQRFSRPHLRST